MIMDLKKLQEMAQSEIEASESRRGNYEGENYPIVYVGTNGKLTVRILYNPKFGGIQRRIIRHDSGKGKVACLQAYGENCPVCDVLNEVEELKGKEAGAKAKYGYKIRGICYAQIFKADDAYLKDSDRKVGDKVLLMYPKSVYDQMNKVIVDAGENLEKLVSSNTGLPVVIERSQVGKGFPEYKVSVYPYGSVNCFEDDGNSTGDQKFNDMLNDLPNLGEVMVPSLPSDQVRQSNIALADIIRQEYIKSSVINPGDSYVPTEKQEEKRAQNVGSMVTDMGNGSVSVANHGTGNSSVTNGNSYPPGIPATPTLEKASNGLPSCYGNHDNKDKKCTLCPVEADCFTESN